MNEYAALALVVVNFGAFALNLSVNFSILVKYIVHRLLAGLKISLLIPRAMI